MGEPQPAIRGLLRVVKFFARYLEDSIDVIAFVLLIGAVTTQILTRFVDSLDAMWTEELSRYLFMIIVFMGASAAVMSRQHIQIELFNFKSPALNVGLLVFQTCAQLVFAIIVIWVSTLYAYSQYKIGAMLSSVAIPRYIFFALTPIAFILYSIRTVQVFVERVGEIRRNERPV